MFRQSSIRLLSTNPYKTIGIPPTATASEIKKKYYKLAKEFHPDQNKAPNAKSKFQEIQEAYDVLSDPEKRSNYDSYGSAEPQQRQSGSNQGFGGFGGFGGFNGGGNPFSDIFNQYGQGGQTRGQDVKIATRISFKESHSGIKKNVQYTHIVTCKPCEGKGVKVGKKQAGCRKCSGTGQVVFSHGGFRMQQPCDSCGGTGRVTNSGDECGSCSGAGRVKEVDKIDINIPKGVSNDMYMRVSGKGDVPLEGPGESGDLLLQILVSPHPLFKRLDNNILFDAKIPLSTAILGGTVTIPTLDGDVELLIKEGTQPLEKKLLRGRGCFDANSKARGDQIVLVKVEVPKGLSAKQKSLLMEAFGVKGTKKEDVKDAGGKTPDATKKGFFDSVFGHEK